MRIYDRISDLSHRLSHYQLPRRACLVLFSFLEETGYLAIAEPGSYRGLLGCSLRSSLRKRVDSSHFSCDSNSDSYYKYCPSCTGNHNIYTPLQQQSRLQQQSQLRQHHTTPHHTTPSPTFLHKPPPPIVDHYVIRSATFGITLSTTSRSLKHNHRCRPNRRNP